MQPRMEATEHEIREAGRRLYSRIRQAHSDIARARRWEMLLMRWCLSDPALRTQVLRFIDCLPSLSDPLEVVRHLKEYFPTRSMRLPPLLRLGLHAATPTVLTAKAVAQVTRSTASAMARLFIAGATIEEVLNTMAQLYAQGFGVSVDLLGEATVSQKEAEEYRDRYLELIRKWRNTLSSPPNLSLKLSSLAFPFDPIDPEGALRQIRPRLGAILKAALEAGGFVNIDMEQYYLRDLTLDLARRILEEDFPKATEVGVVIQAYLVDSWEVTQQLLAWVKSRGTPITIRLVRGAYWDSEVILSRQKSWPSPVYTEKRQTDLAFERLLDLLMENHDLLRVAVATHNVRSITRAIVKAKELGVPQEHWECQVLYGMGEAVQRAVRAMGIPVRIYCPVGELIPGMAYLVRRILENTSHTSFLAMSLMEDRPVEQLLAPPTRAGVEAP